MAENKQVELNNSYYGPTIPPEAPSRPIRRPIRRPKYSLYSLLCAIFKGFTTTLILIGIIILVLWLVYQPDNLRAYAEPTTHLARFDLNATDNLLAYNLTVDLTIRNPNKRQSVHYEHVQATAFYGEVPLGDVLVHNFRQPRKNSTTLRLSFAGQAQGAGESYGREVGEGWVNVGLKVYTRVRLRMVVINSVAYSPEVDCTLRLPVPTNATSVRVGFQRTQCHVDSFM